jgi:hypothetical protein
MEILRSLLARPFYVVVFVAGFLLVFTSCFSIGDLSKFQLSPNRPPIYIVFVPGLVLLSDPRSTTSGRKVISGAGYIRSEL